MTDETHGNADERRLECDLCGERVPAAIYRRLLIRPTTVLFERGKHRSE